MNYAMGYCDDCQKLGLLRSWSSHQGDTSQCGECRGLSPEAIREEHDEHADEPTVEEQIEALIAKQRQLARLCEAAENGGGRVRMSAHAFNNVEDEYEHIGEEIARLQRRIAK